MTLVEREVLLRPFSPGSTLERVLKAFRQRGPKWVPELTPSPLVLVGIIARWPYFSYFLIYNPAS
jgi:hypothetical protein